MKKIFGISLVALFAAAPMMANAAGEYVNKDPSTASSQPANAAAAKEAGLTPSTAAPYFALQAADTTTDHNVVSAGYVKGAYNAAIKAVNKVYEEIDSDKQDALTASSGIDINSTTNKIKVDIASNGGLAFDGEGDSATLKIAQAGVSSTELATSAVIAEKIADNAVTTDKILNNTILVQDIATSAMVAGSGESYVGLNSLAQQGYVDEKFDNITNNYATQTGVVATVSAAKLNVLTEWGSSAVTPTSQIISVDSYVAQQ